MRNVFEVRLVPLVLSAGGNDSLILNVVSGLDGLRWQDVKLRICNVLPEPLPGCARVTLVPTVEGNVNDEIGPEVLDGKAAVVIFRIGS